MNVTFNKVVVGSHTFIHCMSEPIPSNAVSVETIKIWSEDATRWIGVSSKIAAPVLMGLALHEIGKYCTFIDESTAREIDLDSDIRYLYDSTTYLRLPQR